MIYRQGDVLLIATKQAAEGKCVPRENGRVVLAHGEVTGHAHAIEEIDTQLFENDNTRILAVSSEAKLVHEEHATIKLPPGLYEVRQQREYSGDNTSRQVAD